MRLQINPILKRVGFIIALDLILTTFVIQLHTPKPPPLIFDFTCLNTGQVCPVKIDNAREVALQESIEAAVKDSHRLGTLSDVYISVMRFKVSLLNLSIGYVAIASTTAQKVTGNIQCLDGSLVYGTQKDIESYFVLTDSTNALVTKVASYVNTCPGFVITNESIATLPPVPPNSIVTFEAGPQFNPIFTPDLLSWVLIFVFNLIVLTGLFPISREGWRFLKKGATYFS